MNLSDNDLKMLSILSDNGRISYVDLAEKIGLSRVAVRDRIKQMEEAGVIEKYSVVVNSEMVGKHVSAFFEVDCEPTSLVTVAETLAENPKVASCYQMTGPSTLHMHVLVNDFKELESFINFELYELKGITRVESHILLRRFKSRTGLKL